MVEKKVSLMEFESNPNIGLYMFVNDKFCLLGVKVDDKKKKEIESILNVPVYIVSVLGTELCGVFIAGNNDFLLVPDMPEYELEIIAKIAKNAGVEVIVINEKLNTIGNNICVGDNILIINSEYSVSFVNSIKKKTNFEVHKFKNSEFKSAGGLITYINGKYFVSQEITEKEIEPILDKVGGIGSINKGAVFISSGIVGNKNGILLGSACSTVEIQNIVESLEFI